MTRLSQEPAVSSRPMNAALGERPDITPETIDFYVRRGNRLRAQAIGATFSRLFRLGSFKSGSGKAPARVPRVKTSVETQTMTVAGHTQQHLANALAGLRSSLEILRDNPEISESERVRFARAALRDEARIEFILADLMNGKGRAA